MFLPTPRHCEDEGVSPAFGCGNSQLSASGERGGTDGVSDDSSSALPDSAVEVSHGGVGFGTAPAPATADTFLWGDELNEREDRRTLPRPRRSYPLSFWPQSISFLFSPTDLIIPKQKETRNCSSLEINEYTLLQTKK